MKIALTLCVAAFGVVGFSLTSAKAVEPTAATVASLPAIVHLAPLVVVEDGPHWRHHRHWRHRRWYWRHHRRYYY